MNPSFGIILLSGTNFIGKDIPSLDDDDKNVLTRLLHETLEQAFRNIRVDDSYIPTNGSKLVQFIQYSVKVLTVRNRFSYAFVEYMNKCCGLNQQRKCRNSLRAQHVGQLLPKRQRSDFVQTFRPVARFNRMTQLECAFLNNPEDYTDFLVGSYWEKYPHGWFRCPDASSIDINSYLSIQFPKGKQSETDTCLRDTICRELKEETDISNGFHFIERHDITIDVTRRTTTRRAAADTATADDKLYWYRREMFGGMNFAIAVNDKDVETGRTDVHNKEIWYFAWITLKDAHESMEVECDYPKIIDSITRRLVITFIRIARENGYEDILKKLTSH